MANLNDLNDVLFNQINRLDKDGLKGDELKEEMEKARTITQVADKIIQNGHLVLQAAKFKDDKWDAGSQIPKMLDGGKSEQE